MTEISVPVDAVEEIRAFSFAKTYLAATIAERCSNVDRSVRMSHAVERFVAADLPDCRERGSAAVAMALAGVVRSWPEMNRRLLLVDLWFVEPFAPYEVKVDDDDLKRGLGRVAEVLQVHDALGEIGAAVKEFSSSSTGRQIAKVVGAAALGAVVVGSGAWMLAPLVGTALGSAAGLSGAAATAHGLALLGGGTFAAGGGGMAGGMLAVAGAGAASGVLVGGGGTTLHALGRSQTERELLKIRVKFRVSVLRTQGEMLVAQRYATYLKGQIDVTRADLAEERRISEHRSQRIARLESTLELLEQSQTWMATQLTTAELS